MGLHGPVLPCALQHEMIQHAQGKPRCSLLMLRAYAMKLSICFLTACCQISMYAVWNDMHESVA